MFLFIRSGIQRGIPSSSLRLASTQDYFILGNASGSILVRLRKRDAYPVTFCRQLDAHSFELGYGTYNNHNHDEYLRIVVRDDGTVEVERDAYCVLPLFYSCVEGFVLTNLYSTILRETADLAISPRGIQDLLMPFSNYTYPPFQEIHTLGDRQKLQYDGSHLAMEYSSPRPWLVSRDAPETDPRVFPRQFEGFLDYFIQTRLQGQAVAFQVSGGLDSATLPLYLHRKRAFSSPPILTSDLVNSSLATRYRSNVASIVDLTDGMLLSAELTPGVHVPFSHLFSPGNTYLPSYPEPQLPEATLHEIQMLQEYGITVLCTGTGGDDIFENIVDPGRTLLYGEAERKRRANVKGAPFLTEHFYQEFIASVPDEPFLPIPIHARSMYGAQLYINNFYIEAGIWPVSPFADPSLYAYCQGLPAHFRANKNVFRMYHQVSDTPEGIYWSPKEQEFAEVLDTPIRLGLYDSLVNDLGRDARTWKMGYVDEKVFGSTYRSFKATGLPANYYIDLWAWLDAEVSMQYHVKYGLGLEIQDRHTPCVSTGSEEVLV